MPKEKEITRINCDAPTDLWIKFKKKLLEDRKEMREWIIEKIKEYVNSSKK